MKSSFNKFDVNAPRFREKQVTILTKDLYQKFLKKYPEHQELTLKQFKDIVYKFNENLYTGAIDNRDGIELPEGLGFIFMGTCASPKKLNVDIAKSLEHGYVVEHQNWDSDNKLLKIFYTNRASKYPFQNKQVWAFKAVRQFRKSASDAYKKNWPKYIVVDSAKKISDMYHQNRKKDFILSDSQNVPDDYDEFKM